MLLEAKNPLGCNVLSAPRDAESDRAVQPEQASERDYKKLITTKEIIIMEFLYL